MSKYTTPTAPASADTLLQNNLNRFRPLGPPADVGDLAVSLRVGALRCIRCSYVFRQRDAQALEDGVRFVCGGCGLDALEVLAP
jgi:hypothetical protein